MMNVDFPNTVILLQHAQGEKLYQKLIRQLQKDFTLANIVITVDQILAPVDLKTLVHEKVYQLLMERFSEYLHLLYIIDVPEKAFKDIHVTDAVDVAEQVTFLIFKRELEKVWLKTKHS